VNKAEPPNPHQLVAKKKKNGAADKLTKLAGSPPLSFNTSMVAMARPAPLTRQPMLPSSLIKLRPYCKWARTRCYLRVGLNREQTGKRLTHLGSLDLLSVLLRSVTELEDVLLTEVGVVVETKLGVHAVCA
jgi:hypothetical protein